MNTNIVILSGNTTKDPKLMTTGNGVNFVNFSIAVKTNRKDKDGNNETDFFDCVAWRGTADLIYKYIKKGTKVVVNGKLENRTYEDKEGHKRVSTQITVNEIDFSSSASRNEKEAPTQDIPEQLKGFEPIPDETLPF